MLVFLVEARVLKAHKEIKALLAHVELLALLVLMVLTVLMEQTEPMVLTVKMA